MGGEEGGRKEGKWLGYRKSFGVGFRVRDEWRRGLGLFDFFFFKLGFFCVYRVCRIMVRVLMWGRYKDFKKIVILLW